MTRVERPYTPETLADRWGCSANHVRNLIRRGTLPAFRLGRLMRIPAAAVADYEAGEPTCETTNHDTGSYSTEAVTPSSGGSSAPTSSDPVISLAHRAALRSARRTGR